MQARSSGVLLHPGSLPGPYGIGDFGADARHFVDWLARAGQQLWQVLPFAPPGCGNSPYMSAATMAGDPLLISPDVLVSDGFLDPEVLDHWHGPQHDNNRIEFAAAGHFRHRVLREAGARFLALDGGQPAESIRKHIDSFDTWCQNNAQWAIDYAMFMALRSEHHDLPWWQWPDALARREPDALLTVSSRLADEIRFWQFVQWQFDRQWRDVRDYAREQGVRIVGDMPIYCALDSVDVWQQPGLFQLDDALRPVAVAGVPPDYFSETGQRWGNPLYQWDAHAEDGYAWWIARMRRALAHADIVRIDHFRAFSQYWSVPADAETAVDGQWCDGPGQALFDHLADEIGPLPIIAEDLGTITPDVIALRDAVDLPGMCVLQFAFDGGPGNRYAPHNLRPNCVLYTGTHDNNTSRGWFGELDDDQRSTVQHYLKTDGAEIHWDLVHAASSSVARMAIYPMQDLLGLDGASRTNTPGLADGQWTWRLSWEQVEPWHAERLRTISHVHGRCATSHPE